MARSRGIFGRIRDWFRGTPERPSEPTSEPSEPIIGSGGGFFPPEQHYTWRDIESQAYANISDGEDISDTDLREALETLTDYYGNETEARDRLYEILSQQSRAFDSYAIGLDPGPGQELRDQVEALNLPLSLGRYHGNTEAGSHHFYGRRSQ